MRFLKNLTYTPFSFYQEKPTEIRVYPCPVCNETISADANNCRFCHYPIDAATAERLLFENQRVTNAVASANTFRLSVWLAALVILGGIVDLLTNGSSPAVVLPLIAIGYGGLWFYRYRSLITKDADYPLAIKRVKRTIAVWVVALILPLAATTLNAGHGSFARNTAVELEGKDPPTFILSGRGRVTYFAVGIFSPELPEDSPKRVQLIWEIGPKDIFDTKVASVGRISYGTTPPGFTQYTPPVPLSSLEAGQYYVFYLFTLDTPNVMGAFEMKDGKPSRVYGLPFCVVHDEKGKGMWTRCSGDENGSSLK